VFLLGLIVTNYIDTTGRDRLRQGVQYLDRIKTADDASILDVDMRWRVRVAALGIRSATSLPGELAAYLQG